MSKETERTAQIRAGLTALRNERKFVADERTMYFGAPTEEIRQKAETLMNAMIDRLIEKASADPAKPVVLEEFKRSLPQFDDFDSEERDQVGSYCEQIMDVFGIESSDGVLNRWRYGFDPTIFMRKTPE